MPKHTEFEYSFDHLAEVVDRFLEQLQVGLLCSLCSRLRCADRFPNCIGSS